MNKQWIFSARLYFVIVIILLIALNKHKVLWKLLDVQYAFDVQQSSFNLPNINNPYQLSTIVYKCNKDFVQNPIT